MALLAEPPKRRRGAKSAEPLKKVFENVEDPVRRSDTDQLLREGGYGPYVTDGETNASLPARATDKPEDAHSRRSAVQELILDPPRPRREEEDEEEGHQEEAAKKKTTKKKTAKKSTKKASKKTAKKKSTKKASKKAAKKKSTKKAATKSADA